MQNKALGDFTCTHEKPRPAPERGLCPFLPIVMIFGMNNCIGPTISEMKECNEPHRVSGSR